MRALPSGRRTSVVVAVALFVAGAVGADPVGASSARPVTDEVMLSAATNAMQHYDPAILDDSSRPEGERERDKGSKPLEVYAFLGIEPGMTVVDLIPSAGYNSFIISKIVGDEGRVLGVLRADRLQERANAAGLTNVRGVAQIGELEQDSVDVVVTVRNIHDIYLRNMDAAAMYGGLLRALKSGGILGIVDARTDKDGADSETHRINEQLVIRDVIAAGFEFVEGSDILANPDDDHSGSGFPSRWEIDRFLLKFRKP